MLLSAKCSGQEISFRERVQPLLANRCLACHGPDENGRKADLRLDTEAGAKDFAIEPGNADDSELISRIESDDPDVVMPPPGHGKPLSSSEQKLLRDWIDQGAPWQGHWAFEPIKRPSVPADNSGWSKGAIDGFVLQRIKEAGLEASGRADDRTLIRRVYLDLIGLPPTPEQVQQFMDDTSSDRFEKVVDQLLRSKHYGEQMAVSWLDIARYADTNGYQNDFVRSMWVWRDWVIDAYNSNMPYDQFIIQQIAGDMLPEPTTSQLIASGFNRNNPTVTEGGAIDEEWRIENCVDRTETTAAAFLGLTMGCARCHDHKYDPVSQKEFFEFFAFFNNVDEPGVYTERRGNTQPLIKTPTPAQVAALASLDGQIEALDRKAAASDDSGAIAVLQEWRTSKESGPSIPQSSWSCDDTGVKELQWSPAGKAISFEGKENAFSSDNNPDTTFERDQPFSWTCWVHGEARGAIFGKMNEAQGYRGVDTLILGDGRLKVHLISAWDSNAIAVLSKDALPSKWNHVAVTYTGNSKAAGFKIYVDGKPVATTTERDSLTESTVTEAAFKIGQRSQSSHLRGKISQFSLYDSVLTDEQVALKMKLDVIQHVDRVAKSGLDSTADDAALDFLEFSNSLQSEKAKLLEQRKQLIASQQTTMVMRERAGQYRPTWRLNRGQYDQPDKSVDLLPGVPEALPPLTEDQPRNRLGLARWLVDERNPLVARVIVNRAWMKFFGRGLVNPPDNFGIQGSPPSHPELLDWLADDFRSHGWDLKRLHRQIVISATYQQASELTQEKLELDRENRWLSRGPRYRLSAEQIRDGALLMSGLLSKEIGGPSVFPYQPDGLWDELAGGANNGPYKQSSGDDLYRRSLYTYRKRTVPHPTTSTFDAPSWEKCQIKRANTNTPLQALALLNDTTYVEAAKKFAERILSEGGETLDDRIDFAVFAAMSRPATLVEKTTLKDGFRYYLQIYNAQPGEAKKLLAIGESTTKTSDPAELAAMTSVASIILNLDTTITKE
ncbi:DUF1553 domain-containing protein [Bremerella sp. P1]|uniref:DUF1553 domain-containing protein n=1 Tax=Bremerella sp. P1 TaxID=3026424 RepID=UPI002367F9B7|nr:DUF1553 domain-containing protein [Bremerella sp. P1]WDI45192.1 DUF1553 domain-containing protein [Bremerella sp. P1]